MRGSSLLACAGLFVCLLLLVGACGEQAGPPAPDPMTIHSRAFDPGATIPKRHTGEGEDVSPPLAWANVPPEAKELVLVVDDPDAPRDEPWVHWVLYGLPPTLDSLAEGETGGGIEGVNDFGRSGWGGPMPPPGHGVHHYHFKLYALDGTLEAEPGLTKAALLAKIEGRVLAEAALVGTYERR